MLLRLLEQSCAKQALQEKTLGESRTLNFWGHPNNNQGWLSKLEMQQAIMEEQLRQEAEGMVVAASSDQQILLSDRSAIDPVVYAILTSSTENEVQDRWNRLVNSPEFQLALPMYRKAKFFLLKPVPEWVIDDGVRSLDNQNLCLSVFQKTLTELGIVYQEIGEETKDLNERVVKVMRDISLTQL
jgi:AAA domain